MNRLPENSYVVYFPFLQMSDTLHTQKGQGNYEMWENKLAFTRLLEKLLVSGMWGGVCVWGYSLDLLDLLPCRVPVLSLWHFGSFLDVNPLQYFLSWASSVISARS